MFSIPNFVPLKMFSFDNSFDSIHRSDKRAKQVELQQRPISLFKESFEQRRGEYSGRDKNENFLSLLSFIDSAKRCEKTQGMLIFLLFLLFYIYSCGGQALATEQSAPRRLFGNFLSKSHFARNHLSFFEKSYEQFDFENFSIFRDRRRWCTFFSSRHALLAQRMRNFGPIQAY